jgi:branched-chain amino acid transport system substrate-binding protein
MLLMIEMLAKAAATAGSIDPTDIALALEGMAIEQGGVALQIRAADHQVLTDLYVSMMERAGTADVQHDIEGSGFGFRTVTRLPAATVAEAPACRMTRPAGR